MRSILGFRKCAVWRFFVRRTGLWCFWVETVSISRSTRPAALHHQSRFRGNTFVSFHRFHFALVIKRRSERTMYPTQDGAMQRFIVEIGLSLVEPPWSLGRPASFNLLFEAESVRYLHLLV